MKILNKILSFIFIVVLVLLSNLYIFKVVNSSENIRKNVEKIEYAKNNKNFVYEFFKELGEYEVVNINKKVDDFIADAINNKNAIIDREYLKDKLKLEKVDKRFNEKTEVEEKIINQIKRYKVGMFKTIDKIDLKEIFISIVVTLILMFIIFLIINKSVSKTFTNISIVFFICFLFNLIVTFIPNFISFVGNVWANYLNNLFSMYSEYMKELTLYILISLIFLMILLVVLYFLNLYKIKKKGIVTEDNFLDKYEEQKPKEEIVEVEKVKIEEKSKEKNKVKKSKEKK
jgi:hypothetical protein